MIDTNPYRELPEPTPGPVVRSYVLAWRRYRRLQLFASPIAFIGGIVLIAAIHRFFGSGAVAGAITMIGVVIWASVCVASRRRLLAFRCPRCDRRFESFRDTQFEDYCAHCHLRRFELFDPDAKEIGDSAVKSEPG